MGRSKIIPDNQVYSVVLGLLRQDGDKAVAFSSVSRATGLAPATLVQRFGSRDGMLQAAALSAWDRLDQAAAAAGSDAPMNAKGGGQMLKALTDAAADAGLLALSGRDRTLRDRAQAWRSRVEAALALRLGGAAKGREAAAVLFAAWQGQLLWTAGADPAVRMKNLLKRISG